MALQGKGFFIWQIPRVEGGVASEIARLAQEAGLTHVLIKIADGTSSYNVDLDTGVDLVPAVAQALRARGIQVGGWHWVYGYDPVREADIAIRRTLELGLDIYVVNAESPYKEPGKAIAATIFMDRLRAGLPTLPVALSSYRYPSLHPQFPWEEFLEKCDISMPQVYWLLNHNPGEQLVRSLREYQAITPFRTFIPTGAAFTQSGWSPTPDDIVEFLDTARSLNLQAANFYEWANCRLYLPSVWDEIKAYDWAGPVTPPDITQTYIDALNTHDPAQVLALYTQLPVHVTAARTIQGLPALQNWYTSLFDTVLPDATFTLTGFSGSGSTRHLNWTAVSGKGSVLNGSDTFGLSDGKIAYHYTFFTVT